MLGKPAVAVVSQNLFCAVLGNGSADHNVPCSLHGHETRAVGLWRVSIS